MRTKKLPKPFLKLYGHSKATTSHTLERWWYNLGSSSNKINARETEEEEFESRRNREFENAASHNLRRMDCHSLKLKLKL